jgi:CheY-like chemotaxis protein
MKERLQEAGFEVDSAKDGFDALEKLERYEYEFVLLDLMMPGLDGLDVLDRYNKSFYSKHQPKPNTQIVVFSNLSAIRIIEEAFKRGADGYEILYALTFDDIVPIVKKYLNGEISKEESREKAIEFQKKRGKESKKKESS